MIHIVVRIWQKVLEEGQRQITYNAWKSKLVDVKLQTVQSQDNDIVKCKKAKKK